MMADCVIFEEDEICAEIDGSLQFGLVIESSEYASSDEEDDEVWHNVKSGTVRVAWHPSGKEEVIPESNVILVSLSFF